MTRKTRYSYKRKSRNMRRSISRKSKKKPDGEDENGLLDYMADSGHHYILVFLIIV